MSLVSLFFSVHCTLLVFSYVRLFIFSDVLNSPFVSRGCKCCNVTNVSGQQRKAGEVTVSGNRTSCGHAVSSCKHAQCPFLAQ